MNVIVYSTPTCPWCVRAKEYLTKMNVPYQEVDVSANREAAHDMVQKSGQRGVPVLDIDGHIIVGFDQQRIDQLVK